MAATSLKDYLKRYETNTEEEKKKKKKKKKTKPDSTNILVVDEDPVWQKPVNLLEEEEADDSADEKPQIDEDIEVKQMKRLEQVRSRRPYHALSEDGSGWVAVSDTPKQPQPFGQDTDISPPRKRQARYDTPSPEPKEGPADISPPRRARPQLTRDNDISPPRKREARYDTPSPEPEQMPAGISPPRSPRSQSSEDTRRKDSLSDDVNDMSPPRRVHRSHAQDLHNASNDLSPPRKSRREPPVPPKSGLLTAKDVKEEIAKTKREDWLRFKKMDPSVSGRGAEPVYRDKTGKRISKEELLKSQEEKKPKAFAGTHDKKLEWGKGLAQKREAEERLHELELEKDKPFARTRDDPDLDRDLKERVRWGDPMAHLVKRKQPDLVLPNFGDNERMKESGFVVPQEVPNHSWIKRGLDASPNRYGIRPGRHWDGVDRSTGYEKELFKRMNEKKATETEAYLWSVADM